MSYLSHRWLYALGAFMMVVGMALSGCTDAMVGPTEADTAHDRALEATGETAYQYAVPLEDGDNHNEQGRLVMRYFLPFPPDSVQVPSDSTAVPIGRIRIPYSSIIFLPPDTTSVPPDSTGGGSS